MKKLMYALLFFSLRAHGQFMQAEGDFLSPSTRIKTLLLDPEKGIVAASATITEGPCSGHLAGIGKISGRILLLEPYVKVEGGEQCLLQIVFNPKWTKGKITEGKTCTVYHGVACGWEGQEIQRRPR